MRRTTALLAGALLGALVGLVVGWLLLRPSAGDLTEAARTLVPDGFTVDGAGVDEGNVLLGWADVAGVVATHPGAAWDDVDVEDLARAGGWTVVLHDPATSHDFALLTRPGLEARVTVGTADDAAEVTVLVQRDDSEWLTVALAGLGGGVLGLAVGAGARRAVRPVPPQAD